jgi:shikimate kinase
MEKTHLILIGFPSSGKTTLGKALAKAFNMPWVDTDLAISKAENASISDIFKHHGEPYFRQLECQWVNETLPLIRSSVISTGGGLPCIPGVIKSLREAGETLYLESPFDILYERLLLTPEHTLLKHSKEDLKCLFNTREKIYKQAHQCFDCSATPEQLLPSLISQLKKNQK